MRETSLLVHSVVGGEVIFNDGEFAEVQTYGLGGLEKDLLLRTIQIHRCDTEDDSEEFRCRFAIGMHLRITTITNVDAIGEEAAQPQGPVQ